jgi:hypothetical protein
MMEFQLRDESGMWLESYPAALTLAVAMRDALAELLGVQTAEIGCDVREARTADGGRCTSIFIFDHHAAGYTSGAEHLIPSLFGRAAKILDCPKQCDASCPNCVLDYDRRFDANSLDRHEALKFLTTGWLSALKLPQELCFLGASSRVETESLSSAVIRECAVVGAGRARLYVGGKIADLAASPVRKLAYRLLSLARPVALVLEKETVAALSEVDAYSLSALVDHPSAAVHVVDAVPRRGGAVVVAEVERGKEVVAWACADVKVVEGYECWGVSELPLISGRVQMEVLPPERAANTLRPAMSDRGDAEITLRQQLNGPIQNFGKAFWIQVQEGHGLTKKLMKDSAVSVKSVSYTDRYLFTPLTLALLREIIIGLRETLGGKRFGRPVVRICTSAVRQDGKLGAGGRVYSDWAVPTMRDAVAERLFGAMGTLSLEVSGNLKHARTLAIEFSNESMLTLRLDQGVGYWRALSKGKPGANWFDFTLIDPDQQAKAVEGISVWVEGQMEPTFVFAKLRVSANAVTV